MSKFTVILNTDYGYFHWRIEAKDPSVAKEEAIKKQKESLAHYDHDGDQDISVVMAFKGWPESV